MPPITQIPIHFSSPETPAPIPIHHPTSTLAAAATAIQSRYRSHLTQLLVRRLRSIEIRADRIQRSIQLQETVDAVRSDDKERLRFNEELMRLLLELDSVPGYFDENVREVRRNLSRRIVALQEILDGIVREEVVDVEGTWREFLEKIWAQEERSDEEEEEEDGSRKVMRCLENFFCRGLYV